MLRKHVSYSAADAKAYYSLSDYLIEGRSQEMAEGFGGRLAERLGLAGRADKAAFDLLCDNINPVDGTTKLTVRTKGDGERIVGIDFTGDGPKSFSILLGITQDEGMRDAFRDSFRETVAEMEHDVMTRVQRGKRKVNVRTGNAIYSIFWHETARPVDGTPDPQTHGHCFFQNASWCEETGRIQAANFEAIVRKMPYYEAALQSRLAARLEALGFETERRGRYFEIRSVPQSLIDRFSKRTLQQIEPEAQRRGITDPDIKGHLGSDTREKKAKHLTMDELRAHWVSQMTHGERGALADAIEGAVAGGPRAPRVTAAEAMTFAVGKSFERRSSVPVERLVEEALRYGVGSITPEQAWAEITGHGLITAEVRGRELATTEKLQQEEAHVLDFARRGLQACRALVGPGRDFRNTKLNADQRKAVRYLWESGDRVMAILGRAGVGKTTLMEEAAAGIEAAGHRVLAFAPTTKAVRTLRKDFPEAQTVAMLLVNKQLQAEARGQVLLVDEAGMMGTEAMGKLFDLADRLGARVILAGDDRQHKSVARGEPLQLLAAKVLPAVVVRKNMRQQDHPEFQQVAQLLADGKTAEAFREMDRMGLIREVPGANSRHQVMIDAYLAAVSPKRKGKRKTALLEAPTHIEKNLLTAKLREALREHKQLTGKEREFVRLVSLDLTEAERADPASYRGQGEVVLQLTQNAQGGYVRGQRVELSTDADIGRNAKLLAQPDRFEAYRKSTIGLAKGDRVRITRNGTTPEGRRLENGELRSVTGFTRAGRAVLDNGAVLAKEGHFDFGYVQTSQMTQSDTTDFVFSAMGAQSFGAINQRGLYVPVTRARAMAVIFTDDRAGLLKAVMKTDKVVSATEVAARRAARRARQARLDSHVEMMQRRAAEAAHLTRPIDKPARAVPQPKLERGMVHAR